MEKNSKYNIHLLKEINKISNQYNYDWNIEGKQILTDQKVNLTAEEKKICNILLLKEMPKELRRNFWLISSKTRELMQSNVGYYQKLLKTYEYLIKHEHPFYLFLDKKISIDLDRSFGRGIKPTEEQSTKLSNILHAFTVRNISLNYVQGYNNIVVHFLKITNYNEEESFFLFVKLLEDILPFDYYYFSIGIEVDILMVLALLKKYESFLYNKLNSLHTSCLLNSHTSMWLISLFITKMDQRFTNFFFDCVLSGPSDNSVFILYGFIIGIFKILKPELTQAKSLLETNSVFDKLENGLTNEDFNKMIYYIFIDPNRYQFFDEHVKKSRQARIEKIIGEKTTTFNFKDEKNAPCNKLYPFCVRERGLKKDPIQRFTIYKANDSLGNSVIEDYYYGENDDRKRNIDKCSEEEKIIKDIMIERRGHICGK